MVNKAVVKPKHTLLPLLTVLFLISYGLLTMLVVEQGRTIDTQKFLIRQLFNDSGELSALKGGAVHKAQTQGEAKAHDQAQAPSSQGTPRGNAKSDRSTGKVRRSAPQKPPQVTSDTADERRALVSI